VTLKAGAPSNPRPPALRDRPLASIEAITRSLAQQRPILDQRAQGMLDIVDADLRRPAIEGLGLWVVLIQQGDRAGKVADEQAVGCPRA
jgi:hypothetical protein